jgi:hypothetical protein
MSVEIFVNVYIYQKWVNTLDYPIEIISVLAVNNEIVVTFKRK